MLKGAKACKSHVLPLIPFQSSIILTNQPLLSRTPIEQ